MSKMKESANKNFHEPSISQEPCFFLYNNQLMNTKSSLAIILIAMLLSQSLHGLMWQGTGSGMNNTVITEIWNGIETNLDNAMNEGTTAAKNAFVTDISDRLTARWNKAWNVVLIIGIASYDTILYGYAFNNQWMWYNGVPYASQTSNTMATLIIWKDYNCQDWKNIGGSSSFTIDQKIAIRSEANKMTATRITNDVWGTAYTMMKNLEQNALFSSGAYSVIMSQNGAPSMNGRICRVGDGFFNSYVELNFSPIIPAQSLGHFYLFQTR